MSLLRPGQLDLTVAVAENLVPKEVPDSVAEFIKVASTQPIIRRFNFMSQEGEIMVMTFRCACACALLTGFGRSTQVPVCSHRLQGSI